MQSKEGRGGDLPPYSGRVKLSLSSPFPPSYLGATYELGAAENRTGALLWGLLCLEDGKGPSAFKALWIEPIQTKENERDEVREKLK